MEKKTERFIFALTKTERAMLGILAKLESEVIGETIGESAIIRKLIRQAYEKIDEAKDDR